ncbi:keratin-associated protein 16-1-like [Hylaeus volcanicus]|uniref:keratin-associated protein 16-1-like n=1 Tax=Hylaeus volcanicus TaxID=313075 RepID=UPI0023B78DBE|nr:keratin-associated protein 16-1-like [Hylaeus volcanicus]
MPGNRRLEVTDSAGDVPALPTAFPLQRHLKPRLSGLPLRFSLQHPFSPPSYQFQHGACSCSPLKYTHIDICGHLPKPHHLPYSGNPVLALSYCYLIQGKCLTVRNDLPFEMQYVCEVDCKPVCLQPCQPCPPCPVPCEVKVPCSPCDPCCLPNCYQAPPCPPCVMPPSCPPCGVEPVTVVEPICKPNVQKNVCG